MNSLVTTHPSKIILIAVILHSRGSSRDHLSLMEDMILKTAGGILQKQLLCLLLFQLTSVTTSRDQVKDNEVLKIQLVLRNFFVIKFKYFINEGCKQKVLTYRTKEKLSLIRHRSFHENSNQENSHTIEKRGRLKGTI